MARSIFEVMTADPVTMASHSTVAEAARLMRDADIGDVIVVEEDDVILGILTDRDIVVRAVADERVPHDVTLGEVCSREPATLRAGDTVDDVVRVMRERAVRRLPVVEDGRPVGVVSLGDLATTRSGWRRRVTDPGYVAPDDDPALTLADIVEAPPST